MRLIVRHIAIEKAVWLKEVECSNFFAVRNIPSTSNIPSQIPSSSFVLLKFLKVCEPSLEIGRLNGAKLQAEERRKARRYARVNPASVYISD